MGKLLTHLNYSKRHSADCDRQPPPLFIGITDVAPSITPGVPASLASILVATFEARIF